MKALLIFLSGLLLQVSAFAQSNENIQDEIWQKEIQYWKYVAANDTAGYKTLWHDKFLGYPDSVITDKSKIAGWVPEMHNKKDLHYEYRLVKKAVNVFDDVAVVFYDEDDIFRNGMGEIVSTETFKITHTWKKYGNVWLIIGGMSASLKK